MQSMVNAPGQSFSNSKIFFTAFRTSAEIPKIGDFLSQRVTLVILKKSVSPSADIILVRVSHISLLLHWEYWVEHHRLSRFFKAYCSDELNQRPFWYQRKEWGRSYSVPLPPQLPVKNYLGFDAGAYQCGWIR